MSSKKKSKIYYNNSQSRPIHHKNFFTPKKKLALIQFKRTITGATDKAFGIDIKHDILDRILMILELRLYSPSFVRDDPHDSIVTGHRDHLPSFVPRHTVGTIGSYVILCPFFD
jgi:hypothetical protein